MSVQKARTMFVGVAAVFLLFLWLFTPAQKQLVAQVATPPANATPVVIPFPTPDEEGLFCEIDPDKEIPCHAAMLLDQLPPENLPALSNVACVGGMAGIYPCQNIDLLSFTPLNQMGGGSGNDIWGWTDPLSGREYALMGLTNGTSFVDVTDPVNPVYLGRLPTHTNNSTWRDIKVYQNHAFIVSEASGHGIQVFDLTQLRSVVNPPATFANTAHYNGIGSAHNIAINEETGFAYAVGAGSCSGGLHMVNITTPASPTFAGCFSADGYTHDTQCVIYNGPDATHVGKEICFNSNEDTLTIVDVTTKNASAQISRTGYPFASYSHQGWLTEDQHYFLMNDELDEQQRGFNTKTHIWNVADLDTPLYLGAYIGPVAAIDHNLYILGDLVFESNYRSGLRVLNIEGIGSQLPTEVGYFDVYPASNSPTLMARGAIIPTSPAATSL
jgi:choice-of-anchor B domain-containing protein